MSKPSIPQGTRDFSPAEVRKRQYIFNTLRTIFELYGFQPLETPSMENLTTLTGKYGEEGDRLIFKILNNGLHEKKEEDKAKFRLEIDKVLSKSYSSPAVTERALRYDLTIPFARYVVMHQNELAFPFRRYQMQPVWRADRPQKGRYREFWQCDADVVGSTSLINEAELLCIYEEAFAKLGISVIININSRKILAGIAELCGHPDKLVDMTVAIDKEDKIGLDGVKRELLEKGFDNNSIRILEGLLRGQSSYTDNQQQLNELKSKMNGNETGLQGVKEIEQILEYYRSISKYGSGNINISVNLARGLNYYTGMIVEVIAHGVTIGSIGGGGRYDDLTGLFGLKNMSGVGVSFGVDRIYDVIEELSQKNSNIWPEQIVTGTKVLIINFGGQDEIEALSILKHLRVDGVAAELYPDPAKQDKQMKYANKRGIPYVLFYGERERQESNFSTTMVSLKNFTTGEQFLLTINDAIRKLRDISDEGFHSNDLDNKLKSLLNSEPDLKQLNVFADKKHFTTHLGVWLVSKLLSGHKAANISNKEWLIQTADKYLQVKAHSKAKTRTARYSQISYDVNVMIDELVIVVFTQDYKLVKFYKVPWQIALQKMEKVNKRNVIKWDLLSDFEISIDNLPKQDVVSIFR